MATNFYMCETCKYCDTIDVFQNNEYICPRCQSEDIFPERIFRCEECGFEGTQADFFSDVSYDDDPLDSGYKGECPARILSDSEACRSHRIVQIK